MLHLLVADSEVHKYYQECHLASKSQENYEREQWKEVIFPRFKGNQTHSLYFICKQRLFTQEALKGNSRSPHNAADGGEEAAIRVTLREEVDGVMISGRHWTGNLLGGQAQSLGTDLNR